MHRNSCKFHFHSNCFYFHKHPTLTYIGLVFTLHTLLRFSHHQTDHHLASSSCSHAHAQDLPEKKEMIARKRRARDEVINIRDILVIKDDSNQRKLTNEGDGLFSVSTRLCNTELRVNVSTLFSTKHKSSGAVSSGHRLEFPLKRVLWFV